MWLTWIDAKLGGNTKDNKDCYTNKRNHAASETDMMTLHLFSHSARVSSLHPTFGPLFRNWLYFPGTESPVRRRRLFCVADWLGFVISSRHCHQTITLTPTGRKTHTHTTHTHRNKQRVADESRENEDSSAELSVIARQKQRAALNYRPGWWNHSKRSISGQ